MVQGQVVLTIVMAIYGQPKMLAKQVDTIAGYSSEIQDQLSVIIVDDHGDPAVTKDEVERLRCPVQIYRVDDDINWNQMGARNLGMDRAEGWCVMIDPDMVFQEVVIRRMLSAVQSAKRGLVYHYGLHHVTGNHSEVSRNAGDLDYRSPNTYLLHREDFFNAGGYDEDYRGNKGYSDVQMQHVLKAFYKVERMGGVYADFYSNDKIPDAQVIWLDRSYPKNRALHMKKKATFRQCGGPKKWVKQAKGPNLRFKWSKIL